MNEHSRDETKSQESETQRRDTEKQGKKQAVSSRATDYIRAGVKLGDIPQEELLDMASRLGNSNFLELISPQSRIDSAGRIPEPTASNEHKAPNRIKTSPPQLTVPLSSTPRQSPLKPFPASRFIDRAESGAGRYQLSLPGESGHSTPGSTMEGAANGSISH